MNAETKTLGIEIFGDEEQFELWLNSKTIAMPDTPIRHTDEEIYIELQRIAWGIF